MPVDHRGSQPDDRGTVREAIRREFIANRQAGEPSPDQEAEDAADAEQGLANDVLSTLGRIPSLVLEGVRGGSPAAKLIVALREALRRLAPITWLNKRIEDPPCTDDNCDDGETCLPQIRMKHFEIKELRWEWDVINVKQIQLQGGVDGDAQVVSFDLVIRWWARVYLEFLFECKCISTEPGTGNGGGGRGRTPIDEDPSLPGPIPIPPDDPDPSQGPGAPSPPRPSGPFPGA
jgi:hypothetical protein